MHTHIPTHIQYVYTNIHFKAPSTEREQKFRKEKLMLKLKVQEMKICPSFITVYCCICADVCM